MFFARTLRKGPWWFKAGTKLKHDESQSEDMEAYHDEVLSTSSGGLQRPNRYRKLFASFGCALLGIVLFILFTFGYVALTTKLLHHLWVPNFQFPKGGGKIWHRNDHYVRSDRVVAEGLPSLTKHELPVIYSQKIDISFRPKRPKFGQHPPARMFYQPRLMKPDRSSNATTNQRSPFLLAVNKRHFPTKMMMDPEKLEIPRSHQSNRQVAAKPNIMEGRRPNPRIPVFWRHPGGSSMRSSTQKIDDHDEVNI